MKEKEKKQAEFSVEEMAENLAEEISEEAQELVKESLAEDVDSAADLEEALNSKLRLQADFENFKRRSRLDMENMAKYGAEKLILDLLPVLDAFDRALKANVEGDQAGFLAGFTMIRAQFIEALKKHRIEIIESVGNPFDPNFHDAVMQQPVEDAEQDGVIIQELQIGYSLNGKVIRPAMVVVGKHN
ncbi:MAG: nucleotide exchange factor GrpE [Clostridia bacterium]